MKLRRVGWIALGLLAVMGGVASLVGWSITRAPEFYQAELSRPVDRVVQQQQAQGLETRTTQLVDEVRTSDSWSETFDQDGINSWLAVELEERYRHEIPPGIQDPRVRLEEGFADIAFRARDPRSGVQTVVSLRVRPMLTTANHLDLEIRSAHAGLVRVPIESTLDTAVSRLKQRGWAIDRVDRDGHRVLRIHLRQLMPPGAVLERLDLAPGRLHVAGSRVAEAEMPADEELAPPASEETDDSPTVHLPRERFSDYAVVSTESGKHSAVQP